MQATIYHNPKCSTSRKVLEQLRQSGIEPTVIDYLKTPPTRAELAQLLAHSGLSARDILRSKEPMYAELDLGNDKWRDDELLDFIAVHPILLNRPIVQTELGTRVCRPIEVLLDILPTQTN